MVHVALGSGSSLNGNDDMMTSPGDPADDEAHWQLLDMVGQCVTVDWSRYHSLDCDRNCWLGFPIDLGGVLLYKA
jgi:hypothetical protein